MPLGFDDSLTQYVQQDVTPINDYGANGFSVYLLARLSAVGSVARTLWCLSDPVNASNYLAIRMTSGEIPNVVARAGGTENVIGGAQVIAANNGYSMILGVFVSATSRRVTNVLSQGLSETASGSTSRAPTGMSVICLGALNSGGTISEPWSGEIGEYALFDGTVTFGDGAAVTSFLDTAMHRYIHRHYSTLSYDRYRRNLIEYRSFRTGLNGGYAPELVTYGPKFPSGSRGGPFSAPNGVTVGRHVPLLPGRANPMRDTRRLVVV